MVAIIILLFCFTSPGVCESSAWIACLTLGVIHILRNQQGGGGFRNDYANVIFALSNAEFDYGRGEGV